MQPSYSIEDGRVKEDEEVRNYPCIYDKSKKSYKEKDVVKNAWENVALKLDFLQDGENFFDIFFT